MTNAKFRKLADSHNLSGRTREGMRLIHVNGLTAYAAALKVGIDQSALSRAQKRFLRALCPKCKRPMPVTKSGLA